MKKLHLICLLLLCSPTIFAQCDYYDDPAAVRVNGTSFAPTCSGNFTFCSKNGFSISPYGGYRVLNLMINIVYDATPGNDPLLGYPSNFWYPGTPGTVNSNPPSAIIDFMDADFTALPPSGAFTRKYFESSFGAMHVVGDFVVVDVLQSAVPGGGGGFGWGPLINTAIGVINSSGGLSTLYGHNTINDYDFCARGFAGLPKSTTPNGLIDFVQVLFRNSTDIYGGRKIGQGATGFGSLFGTNILMNGNYYNAESVSIQGVGNGTLAVPNGIIVHELAHNLFGGNDHHTSGGNHYGTTDYITFLGVQAGHGLMGSANVGLSSCNGYERYRMGWHSSTYNPNNIPIAASNVASDVDKAAGNKTFILRDFVTTGDAVRIKLPYKDAGANDQYLWLENHKVGLNGKIDYLNWSDIYTCRPQGTPGVYAYIQVGKNILESNNSFDVYPGDETDHLNIVSAQGNYDHTQVPDELVNCVAYGMTKTGKETDSNPLSGNHDQNSIFYNNLTSILNKNFGNGYFITYDKNNIKNDKLPWLGDNSDAFTNGSTLSLSNNPTPSNLVYNYYKSISNGATFSHITTNKNSNHIFLSGLKITFTQLGSYDYQVDIVWNDYNVNNDVRWCGPIIMKEQVLVATNKTVTLDQSRTAYKVNRDATSGEFCPITTFECEAGSYFKLNAGSKLVIQNNSQLILKGSSTIEMLANSEIRVKTGSKLILEPNSALFNNGGKIIIEDGATLEYDRALVTLVTATSTLEIAGVLSLLTPTAPPNVFYFTGAGFIRFNNSTGTGNNIICGNDCNISLFGATNTQKVLEVLQPKLIIPTNLASLNFANGRYLLQGGAVIQALGVNTVTETHYATFSSTNGIYNSHKGFWLNGQQASFYYSNFSCGVYGIYNNQTAGGNSMFLDHCYFTDNGAGLYTYDKAVTMLDCTFDLNRGYGWLAKKMSLVSFATRCYFTNTTLTNGYGASFDGTASGQLISRNSFYTGNKTGVEVQNAILSGSCNTISNNIDEGISLLGGATLDFSGVVDIYMPLNDVSNNPISILSTGSKYILLSDGYNKLIPNNGGLSISGTIKKLCNPTPSAIVANYNNWDGATIPPTNYSLTTLPNQGGCPSTPLSVAVTDAHPGPFPYSCNSSAMMISGTSPINNCPSCDNIYTPHFSGKGLEEASVEALEKTTQVGGNDYKEAVNMYNEILMYNLPNPDAAEKYVLNHSYNNMLPALGRAFSIGQITEAQNKIALTPEVQKTIDVQDKLIAEANANNAYLDKYYLTLDKAQTYRLAGRRDLAFTVLDDLATWIQPEQTDYFNYWSCTTRLEQDLIDGTISYDDFTTSIDNCGTSANYKHGQTAATQNTNTTSINLAQLVNVYPNPVKDNLTIENLTGIQIKIELTNTMGKVMYSNKFSDSSFNLNCASFKKGIYSLAISDISGFKFSVKKVVVY